MRYVTTPKHAFLNYGTASGVYPLGDKTVLAVAGDWGTGTDEAQHLTCEMKKHNPDYTVHLGDVYYVGDLPGTIRKLPGREQERNPGCEMGIGMGRRFTLMGTTKCMRAAQRILIGSFPELGTVRPDR